MQESFPNLVLESKWHTKQRNLVPGDVVLIQNANPLRGKWQRGRIVETIKSKDGRVRRVLVSHITDEGTHKTIERPVQKLILLVPNQS